MLPSAEFGYQWYSPVDLANFYKMYNLPSTPVTVVGNNDGPQSGGEGNALPCAQHPPHACLFCLPSVLI